MAITVLVTGFGPFPGAPRNPTGRLARRLVRVRRPAFAVTRRVAHVFDTRYAAIERELPAIIARERPDALLMFGLATRTPHVRIETRARNAASMVFPDADGRKPAAPGLTGGAPPFRRVRAPIMALLRAARMSGAPAALSQDAGRYVCNALFWRALEASRRGGPMLIAFVHVPRLRPGFGFTKLARAGEAILAEILAAARRPR